MLPIPRNESHFVGHIHIIKILDSHDFRRPEGRLLIKDQCRTSQARPLPQVREPTTDKTTTHTALPFPRKKSCTCRPLSNRSLIRRQHRLQILTLSTGCPGHKRPKAPVMLAMAGTATSASSQRIPPRGKRNSPFENKYFGPMNSYAPRSS